MATVTLKGNAIHTSGQLPTVGNKAPDFQMTANDLSTLSLGDFQGEKLVLNIFPSIDTGTCAQSVRQFNQEAAELENTKVLCISRDLLPKHASVQQRVLRMSSTFQTTRNRTSARTMVSNL